MATLAQMLEREDTLGSGGARGVSPEVFIPQSRGSLSTLGSLGALFAGVQPTLANLAGDRLAAFEGRPVQRNPVGDVQAQFTRQRAAEQAEAEKDREAAANFLRLHEQLAKVPTGPEKQYMIDALGKYATRAFGVELPPEYLAMLKKQNAEQQAAYTEFLKGTVEKYNLGLTGGLLPLIKDRPDLVLTVVGKEFDLRQQQQAQERATRDEALRKQLLQGVVGGAPVASPGALSVQRPAGGPEGAVTPTAPPGRPDVTSSPGSAALRGATDERIAAYDTALERAALLSPSPENQRLIQRLQEERDRFVKDRERAIDRLRQDEERLFRREERAEEAAARRANMAAVREEANVRIGLARQEASLARERFQYQQRRDEQEVERKVQEFTRLLPLRKQLAEAEGLQGAVAQAQGKPLEPSERERLSAMSQSGEVVQALLTEFTPEERARYVGALGLRKTAEEVKAVIADFAQKTTDQAERSKFARFSALVALGAAEAFERAGAALTKTESDVVFGYIPTGKEFTSTQFEEKLRLASQRLPNMIERDITLATTPRGKLTAETFHKSLSVPSPESLLAAPPTSATPASSQGTPGSRLQGMTEQEISLLSDADLQRFTNKDLAGLSPAQLRALKGRMQRKGTP